MKTEKKNIVFSIFILLTLISFKGWAQDTLISKSKTIERVFDGPDIEYFGVTNFFGDIRVSYWEQNKVKISATIKVIAWQEEDANEFIEKLIPEISLSSDKSGKKHIYALTNISKIKNLCNCDGENGLVYSSLFKKKIKIKQYNVSYDIKIPVSIKDLDIQNSYGNISMPDYKGSLILTLNNGNIKAGNLKLNNSSYGIHIRYGKGNIESLENTKLTLYSCTDIHVGSVKNIQLVSKFSDININFCSELNMTSQSDNLQIESLESLIGKGNFTKLRIKELNGSVDFSNKSGEIKIDQIDPRFKDITLAGQFNDYNLNLSKHNYSLSAELEFTDLESSETICSEQRRKELIGGKASIEKQIGSQTGNSRVNLKCSNCNVVFR